jgi:hypothetical protein
MWYATRPNGRRTADQNEHPHLTHPQPLIASVMRLKIKDSKH